MLPEPKFCNVLEFAKRCTCGRCWQFIARHKNSRPCYQCYEDALELERRQAEPEPTVNQTRRQGCTSGGTFDEYDRVVLDRWRAEDEKKEGRQARRADRQPR